MTRVMLDQEGAVRGREGARGRKGERERVGLFLRFFSFRLVLRLRPLLFAVSSAR